MTMDRLIFFLKVQNNTPDFVPFNEGNIFPLYTHRRSDNTVREKYFCKHSFLLDQENVSNLRNDVRAYQFNNQNNSDHIVERLNKCGTLGEKIRELRLYHNISAREMYTFLNINKRTLQDYENNNIIVPNDILKRICLKCNESEYLLFDEYRLFLENYDKIILQYCKSTNTTIPELARQLSLSKPSVYAWTKRKSKPTYENWLAICKIIKN